MGSRMFLLLGLVLLIFTDHSQGVPETHEQSLIVNTFTDASDVGEPLITANPVNTPRQHNRLCNCTGKGREMGSAHCLCQQAVRRYSKSRKPQVKTLCKKRKNKNKKKCNIFTKQRNNGRRFGPSVPI
ncbi:uncharacterized protein ABDE67_006241 [Symphorus nematophorus]